ncbi:MAG: ribulose-phosphate 3-epimerase [Nitrospirae bacterium]|nr:MAG: ribulose-phosphate 3-epimerase [Nitrospirota bacterium]
MVMIAPSILSADFKNLGGELKAAEEAGADLIHVDVMDGHFVPNMTIGQEVVRSIRDATKLPFDVHLMIEKPERYIKDFAHAGADIITVHQEASVHLHRTVQAIREAGAKPGVSINPATPVSHLVDILPDLYLVLIMSVNPGFGGQSFIPICLEKIKKLSSMRDELNPDLLIEVDGGVKPDNAREIVSAGADILVMGSAFFGAPDYGRLIEDLRSNIAS